MDISLKRILAYIIDIAIITIVVTLISQIKVINPYLDDYKKNYETYNDLVAGFKNGDIESDDYENQIIENNYELSRSNIINGTITIVGLILYFGVAQMLLDGQTIGKRIMNIKLVSKDESKKLHFGNYLIRTIVLNNILFRILILGGVYFLNQKMYYNYSTVISFIESILESIILIMVVLKRDNRGLHDIIAGTKVVEINTSEKAVSEDVKVIETKETATKKKQSKSKKSIKSN